jgi:hypothetical protein
MRRGRESNALRGTFGSCMEVLSQNLLLFVRRESDSNRRMVVLQTTVLTASPPRQKALQIRDPAPFGAGTHSCVSRLSSPSIPISGSWDRRALSLRSSAPSSPPRQDKIKYSRIKLNLEASEDNYCILSRIIINL